MRTVRLCVLLSLFTAVATTARAQPLVDPNFLEFTVSPDHDALDPSGVAIVQRYDLLLYTVGSSTPTRTVPLGKPAPDPAGTVRLPLTTIFSPLPAGGISYEVRIAAAGPGGSAASAPSNAFTFGVPCSYSVTPSSRSVAAASSTSTFSVTAPAGCDWTAQSGASWISITGGANGAGNGTVTFTIAGNPTALTRAGTLTIAGLPRSVNQSGVPCTFAVSPTAQSVVRAGGAVSFAVTSPTGCTWSAAEQVVWISITAGATGSGSGSVTFAVAANGGTALRTASATIAGRTVTFSQSAGAAPSAPTGMRVIKQ